jgi:hypothetical protein
MAGFNLNHWVWLTVNPFEEWSDWLFAKARIEAGYPWQNMGRD